MGISDFIVKEGIQGSGVFTTKKYAPGEVVHEMQGEILSHPTRTSVQVGEKRHIEDAVGVHVNHHCQPNVRVDWKDASLVALRVIQVGEEITFDYNQNEEHMANPFICQCCGRLIEGQHVKSEKSAPVK